MELVLAIHSIPASVIHILQLDNVVFAIYFFKHHISEGIDAMD